MKKQKKRTTKKEAELRKDIRIVTDLDCIVQGYDESDEPWKEVTTVMSTSRSGAGFSLTRPCRVGRLVKLVTPFPVELRAYDHDEELYPVVGLVQYCQESKDNDEGRYNIGVAFVGKHIPESFTANPSQSYRISGGNELGMWSITESQSDFKSRSRPRFRSRVAVSISLIKKDRSAGTYKEETVTNDISATGASVVCSLDVQIGDRVKFASKEHNFYAIALVRNRRIRNNEMATLHLEFLENTYPIEKIPALSVSEEPVGTDK